MTEPTQEQLGDVITALVTRADNELLALAPAELAGQWYWRWDAGQSAEWNTYKFSDSLEMHKRRCRRWEEHHHGNSCVVERVRDKYLMPRVREFLAEQATHRDAGNKLPTTGDAAGDRNANPSAELAAMLERNRHLLESLVYVQAYLESAVDDENESGRLMSSKPLLGDVRRFLHPVEAGNAGKDSGLEPVQ